MAKYRMKPVEVEAWQYTGDNMDELREIVGLMRHNDLPPGYSPGAGAVWNPKGGSYRVAEVGDWIIRDADGDIRTCKPDVFAATYEPVED